jgi:hypothetical protein
MFHKNLYGSTPGVDPAGVADVITSLLTAPAFLLMTEHGDTPVAGKQGVFTLSPFELASRLSYQFWSTMPDQALWDAAKSGALKTPQGYAAQLDRLIGDPRAKTTVLQFFDQWLRVEDLPVLTTYSDRADFKSFAGNDLPKDSLRGSMVQEIRDMVEHIVWQKNGSLADLLQSPLVFPRTGDLAKLYGVPVWMPGTPPPEAAVRPGLLTRGAFLASGTANTRPIHRGVFIRRGLLCDVIPDPPNNNAPPPPPLSETQTTRQQIEALTESPAADGATSSCSGCHKAFINPIGFALESFDGLGRYRTEQRLFSSTTGKEIGRAPIDSTSSPQIVVGDQQGSKGFTDLSRQMNESGKVTACLARNYYRVTFSRNEDLRVNGCTLEQSRERMPDNLPLRAALRDVALGAEFKVRGF